MYLQVLHYKNHNILYRSCKTTFKRYLYKLQNYILVGYCRIASSLSRNEKVLVGHTNAYLHPINYLWP